MPASHAANLMPTSSSRSSFRRPGISLNAGDIRSLRIEREVGYCFETDALDVSRTTYVVSELTDHGVVVVPSDRCAAEGRHLRCVPRPPDRATPPDSSGTHPGPPLDPATVAAEPRSGIEFSVRFPRPMVERIDALVLQMTRAQKGIYMTRPDLIRLLVARALETLNTEP